MSFTTDSILKEWQQDSVVDPMALSDGALRTSQLHAKYFDIFIKEKMRLMNLKKQQAKMKKLRFEYWEGKLSREDLNQYGWEPQPLKILKQDLPMYLEADDVLSDLDLKVGMQAEKVNLLEGIIKHVDMRMGFAIKSAIDWEKFKSGL
jgi:hypothetical protein